MQKMSKYFHVNEIYTEFSIYYWKGKSARLQWPYIHLFSMAVWSVI